MAEEAKISGEWCRAHWLTGNGRRAPSAPCSEAARVTAQRAGLLGEAIRPGAAPREKDR